jgi:hypothetical protein
MRRMTTVPVGSVNQCRLEAEQNFRRIVRKDRDVRRQYGRRQDSTDVGIVAYSDVHRSMIDGDDAGRLGRLLVNGAMEVPGRGRTSGQSSGVPT